MPVTIILRVGKIFFQKYKFGAGNATFWGNQGESTF